ncbi:carboxymuconolactone decarboxylase family protein [Nocardia aurea]|uniref:Carboxymuconolactone decarboxylase family protein n=1 Tax=Nocardia aurea TaxID=2144174 RepID=A0ABV3G2U7_9NOCA|nr:carboxymuconolactone decarboxylase family protein [Nocardia aurea]
MRLGPLPEEEWDDEVISALSRMLPAERRNAEKAGNVLTTMARHPALTKAFLTFNVHLLFRSTLTERLRELAILRVAYRRNCAYEWDHHARMGIDAGLTETEVEAARGNAQITDDFDLAVLRAVDELDEKSNLSDETWAALSERFSERQIMDFVFTVGAYAMLASAINTFGIEVDTRH